MAPPLPSASHSNPEERKETRPSRHVARKSLMRSRIPLSWNGTRMPASRFSMGSCGTSPPAWPWCSVPRSSRWAPACPSCWLPSDPNNPRCPSTTSRSSAWTVTRSPSSAAPRGARRGRSAAVPLRRAGILGRSRHGRPGARGDTNAVLTPRVHLTFMPGFGSPSTVSNIGCPSSLLAARIIPFDSMPISFAGLRFATMTIVRPTSASGS